jgi:hypothetical protein
VIFTSVLLRYISWKCNLSHWPFFESFKRHVNLYRFRLDEKISHLRCEANNHKIRVLIDLLNVVLRKRLFIIYSHYITTYYLHTFKGGSFSISKIKPLISCPWGNCRSLSFRMSVLIRSKLAKLSWTLSSDSLLLYRLHRPRSSGLRRKRPRIKLY